MLGGERAVHLGVVAEVVAADGLERFEQRFDRSHAPFPLGHGLAHIRRHLVDDIVQRPLRLPGLRGATGEDLPEQREHALPAARPLDASAPFAVDGDRGQRGATRLARGDLGVAGVGGELLEHVEGDAEADALGQLFVRGEDDVDDTHAGASLAPDSRRVTVAVAPAGMGEVAEARRCAARRADVVVQVSRLGRGRYHPPRCR
ncbi:MAG: hypothetical protein WKG00_02285 [Polyangiaceae bacterium]